MPAKNDNAVRLKDRVFSMGAVLARDRCTADLRPTASSLIAGKPRSNGVRALLEPGLPAKNDDAVHLKDRVFSVGAVLARDRCTADFRPTASSLIAGKPRSNGVRALLEPGLPAKNDDAVRRKHRLPQGLEVQPQ